MKIKANQLKFAYGAQEILSVNSVAFEGGKIYGIVGRNGVGKTTFFKTLTNIITNYSGQVLIDNQDVKEKPEILANVGITLDDMQLYKSGTGIFNLRYFGGLRGNFDEAKALKLAESLAIADALDKKVSSYSLGMNKKLILLISLMNDAKILIFDEPFRGIDFASVEFLKSHFRALQEAGCLILISSHVQEDIETLCDEVLVLDKGDFGAPFDLKDASQILIYTVETKQTEALINILVASQVPAKTKGNLVKFEVTQAEFQEIFRKAVPEGIEFDEIKKESKFAEMLGESQQSGQNQGGVR